MSGSLQNLQVQTATQLKSLETIIGNNLEKILSNQELTLEKLDLSTISEGIESQNSKLDDVETQLTEILTKLENNTRLPISEIKIGFLTPIRGQLSSLGTGLVKPSILPILEISNYSEEEKNIFFNEIDKFINSNEEILKLEMKNINLGNDSNEINPSNITFYIANTASDDFSSAKAIENANKLIQEGIQIIIGPARSSVSLELIPEIAIKNNIPMISYANTGFDLTTTQNNGLYSRVIPVDGVQGILLGKLASKTFKKAVTIYINDVFGNGINNEFKTEFANNGGEILKEIAINFEDSYDPEKIPQYLDQINTITDDYIILCVIYDSEVILEYLKNKTNAKKYYFIDSVKSDSYIQFFPNNSYIPAYGKSELIQNYYSKVNSKIDWSSGFEPQVYDSVALSLLALSINNNISGSLFTSIISKLTEKSNNEYIRASELRKGLNLLNENKIINYRGYSFSNLSKTSGNGYEPTDTIENLNTYTLFTIENNEFVKVEYFIN